MADVRGNPWEYDPGPTGRQRLGGAVREHPELPRARQGGARQRGVPLAPRPDVLPRPAGRLRQGVVLVGQEGAQDESLSHRSFTGGTGARMQHFLRHLGIDRSYLFLNSFVYPIFGQYGAALRPLAQDPRSPIVKHRHQILDKAVIDGGARLVVAVGTAAKESIATWIESHGGTADSHHLETATLGSIPSTRPGRRRRPSRLRRRRVDRRHQGRLPARDQPDQGMDQRQLDLAARRCGYGARPDEAVRLQLDADPVPRLPVRHLPAAGTRRDVEQPQRQPARHPAVLGPRRIQRRRRAPRATRPTRPAATPGYADDTGRRAVRAAANEAARVRRRARPPRWQAAAGCRDRASPGPTSQALGVTSDASFGVGADLPRTLQPASASWCWPTRRRTTTCSPRGR